MAALILAVLVPVVSSGLSTARIADRSWHWQNPRPQGNALTSLSFPSTSFGYATGRSGTILKTSDGGGSWTSLDTGGAHDFASASFPTTSSGWLVGDSGTIVYTADGGSSFTTQTSGTSAFLRGVSSITASEAIAVGDAAGGASTIRFTTSAGTTWSAGVTTATAGLNAVAISSPTLAWAVGGSGTMLRSTDGGATWTTYAAPTAASINAICLSGPGAPVGYAVGNNVGTSWTVFKTIDGANWSPLTLPGTAVPLLAVDCFGVLGEHVVVAGANGAVYRSSNGGVTWTVSSPARLSNITFTAVSLPSLAQVSLAGDHGALLVSRDGGVTWLSQMQTSPATLFAAAFTSASNGWAVGSGGLLMKTGDGGITWTARQVGTGALRGIASLNLTSAWLVGDGGSILYTTNAGSTWTTQTSGVTSQLNDVFFDSPNKGTAVGSGGVILTTANSGSNWSRRASGTSQALNSVWYASNSRGWVVGRGGVILSTTTGGANWNLQSSGTTQALHSVWAADTQNVWAVGDSGTVLRTTNGGTTWIPVSSGTTQTLRAVTGSGPGQVWIGGGRGLVRRTLDGGVTWTTQSPGLPSLDADVPVTVNHLQAVDANNVFLVADRGEVRSTIDGGLSWTPSYYATLQTLEDIDALSASRAWASGANGTLLNTFDGGLSWYRQIPGTAANLNGVAVPSPNAAWVAGDNGVIRYTTNGGWTWTAQTSGTTARLADVDASSDTNAIAVGNGVIRYYNLTAPAGWKTATSTPANAISTRQFNRVSMPTNSVAFAVANSGAGATVLKSTDGGASWSVSSTMTTTFFGVHFEDALNGWVVGAGGAVHRTSDGGANWLQQSSGTTVSLRSVHFTSLSDGRATGDGGVALQTADGGATWLPADTGTTSKSLRGAYFFTAREGWVVGSDGTVLAALDLTKPTTTILVSPSSPDGPNDNDWYISYPLIQLIPSTGSTAYYSWVSDSGPFTPYLTPLVAMEGTSTLHYYSADASGQVEPVASRTFQVDVSAPTTPTGLSVSAVTASSATASWNVSTDAISGVATYEFFLNGVSQGTTETLSFDITGLSANTVYTVAVRAIDVAGIPSALSAEVSFTTEDTPGEPLGVQMTLAPTDPDGQNGWYVTTPTVTLTSIPTSVPADIYYRFDSDVTTYGPASYPSTSFPAIAGAYTLYYEASTTVAPTRPVVTYASSLSVDPFIPHTPQNLTATATTEFATELTWTSVAVTTTPSGLQGYHIYRDGVLIETLTSLTTPTVTYAATGLSPSTTYTFGVRSLNYAGSLSATATLDVTTSPPASPDPPRITYARGTDGDSIYLNWEPVSDAVGVMSYGIERSTGDTSSFSLVATVTGRSEFSYVDTGLSSSTQYWYRVSSHDDRGASDWSTPTAGLTRGPYRVSGLTDAGNPGGAVLSWQASTNPAVVGYYVYRSDYSLTAGTTLTVIPTTETSYIDPVLPGVYWYRVAAIDASAVVGSPSIELRVEVASVTSMTIPHGTVDDSEDECAGCHRGHTGLAPNLTIFPFPDATSTAEHTVTIRASLGNQSTCLSCHDGVSSTDIRTSVESSASGSRHDMKTTELEGSLYCGSCHASHRSNVTSDHVLLDVNGVSTGTAVCYECHGPSSLLPQGDLTVFEQSAHASATPDSRIGVSCTACHETHASANEQLLTYSGWMICMQCHGGRSDPRTPDILTLISSSDDHENRHDLTREDQIANGGSRITCQNCHNTHAVTGEYPLVDPDNPSVEPTATWTQDLATFCFRCHDGLLPTALQTEPWVAAPLAAGGETTTTNIAFAFQANVHGFGESTATALYLRPEMGYSIGDVISCDVCHDGHGTVNPMNLRQDIPSADRSTIIEGALVAPAPGGFDMRFFCAACHDIDPARHLVATAGATSIESFPMDCTSCHMHTTQGSVATTETGTSF